MSVERTEGRRTNHRAFRPTVDDRLETREMLSGIVYQHFSHTSFFLKHPKIGVAYKYQQPPLTTHHAKPFDFGGPPVGNVGIQTAHGGQSVRISTSNGNFNIALTTFFPTAPSGALTSSTTGQEPIQNQIPGAGGSQPIGTVRAYPMSNGRVGLIVDGTTTQSELDISPVGFPQKRGYAHSFAYGQAGQSHLLNIGQITVNTGLISAINGFHTANLSGSLIVSGTQPVDRIAFDALLPGASIETGGDLNTLDVLNGVNLNSGPGIVVGRDLNLFNAGLDVDLSNGASIRVGRFLGLTPQPVKGTGTGSNFLSLNQSLLGTSVTGTTPSLAGYLQGNLNLSTGSQFVVLGGIPVTGITSGGVPITSGTTFLVNGKVTGDSTFQSQIQIANLSSVSNNFATGGAPFVARNGFQFTNFVFPTPTT